MQWYKVLIMCQSCCNLNFSVCIFPSAMKHCTCGKRFQGSIANDLATYHQATPRDDKLTFSPSSSGVSSSFDVSAEGALVPTTKPQVAPLTIDTAPVDKACFQLPRVLVVDGN